MTRILCLAAAFLLLTGCATNPVVTPLATPPSLPTLTPATSPPKTPTDEITDAGWVVGTVVRGGSGPCYGLETDDGTQYAMHNADGLELARNTRVRVKITPSRLRIDCGAGDPVEVTVAEPVR